MIRRVVPLVALVLALLPISTGAAQPMIYYGFCSFPVAIEVVVNKTGLRATFPFRPPNLPPKSTTEVYTGTLIATVAKVDSSGNIIGQPLTFNISGPTFVTTNPTDGTTTVTLPGPSLNGFVPGDLGRATGELFLSYGRVTTVYNSAGQLISLDQTGKKVDVCALLAR